MPQKRLLTPDFVDRQCPPDQGEVWIADTMIKGFGLRLWATASGGNKAFCFRGKGMQGIPTRRTFSIDRHLDGFDHFLYDGLPLGRYLEIARRWAIDCKVAINNGKGLSQTELFYLDYLQRRADNNKINGIEFGRAARAILKGFWLQAKKKDYIKKRSKYFKKYISVELQKKPFKSIDPKDIAECFDGLLPGQSHYLILRNFITRVYEEVSYFDYEYRPLNKQFLKQVAIVRDRNLKLRLSDQSIFNLDTLHRVKAYLMAEEKKWQQACCIRMFLEVGSSLSRVMQAKWSQIIDKKWYPYLPHEHDYWYECAEEISPALEDILLDVKQKSMASDYFFPSDYSRSVPHIKSIDTVWRHCLYDLDLPYISLVTFRRRWKPKTAPSQYKFLIDHYYRDEEWEIKSQKVAEQLYANHSLHRRA